MGKAYLARALGPGGFQRLVVIKRLSLRLLGTPDAVERFLAEARVAARIHHANVIGTQQVGRDAAGPFIVLDYVEGGSIDDLVLEGELPIPVVLRIALDALYGLEAVHEAKDVDGRPLAILHRDVSLQNILVSVVDGVARLSDFGVAKSALGRIQTDEGVLLGKLIYFPPEYLRRERVGPPLDLYALGVTLWLALTREEPWHDANDAQVVRAILDEGIPPLDRYVEVAPQISEFIMRACARDPLLRFQSARDMASVLERFDRERGWLATHTEVAHVVQNVLGPDLQLRRNAVVRLTRAPEIAVTGTYRDAAPAAPHARSGTVRLDRARPEPLPDARQLAPTVPLVNDPPPVPSSRLGPLRPRFFALLLAFSAGLYAMFRVISFERVEERADGTPPRVTDRSASPPASAPILVAPVAPRPVETVEITATFGSIGGAMPSASPSETATPRREKVRAVLPRITSGPETLRTQNPYRRGSSD
jgi:serine/threonine-protein kinase